MLITTQDNFSEFQIEKTLGLVRGNTVRTRNFARNFIASLRTIIGGEVPEYTKAANDARDQALERMIQHATEVGADAIVGVRFITSEIGQTCAEILAYGTAVKLRKL
ncbi:MAG: YbjQ family protein [Legionellales bacterium]|nr:YbjQ family protein [Legionellales bacterium]